MPTLPPSVANAVLRHSSVALARASLLKFVGLLAVVFMLASYLLVYIAHDLDRSEDIESEFYLRKAMQSLENSLRVTVKDYAFWGDAYRHLHLEVDSDWAYVRQNLGPTLYEDFGFQGVFVVSDTGRNVYSVLKGELGTVGIDEWLGQPVDAILAAAREGAESETPITVFINAGGVPALVAAAALTPGTDPSVSEDDRSPSVLLFVDLLDEAKLQSIGKDYGIAGLRVANQAERAGSSTFALGSGGTATTLDWDPPRPGQRLLGFGLPLIGLAAFLVCLMAWVILRRSTAAARALDASFASLQSSQAALATSESRFRDVVEASSDWVWEIDQQGCFIYLSERFEFVTGLRIDTWVGAPMDGLLKTETGTVTQWLLSANRRPDTSIQCRYVDAQQRERITRLSARAMSGAAFRGTATDVTDEVQARQRIEFLSQHDALTGLPNRTRLQAFLDGKLQALPSAEYPLVMLSLDLDRFKPVNDLLGHAAGDRVLNEASIRLAECVRHGDLVARVGGDEFVLILSDVSSQEEVEALCQRLIATIERPISVEQQEVFISASIGIAMAPNDALEATDLLRYADIALYEAKAGGRNTWRFYAGDMNARILERRRLESDLRFAIAHDELRLHYQPRYRIADGQLVGAEALVRWQHPERGLIPPDTFIPIAEESGLILSLSNWVLATAFSTAAGWPEHLFVSVNLSPSEFQRGHLVERVHGSLVSAGIDPARVELEITESVMLDDAPSALAVITALKALGVRIAMDDFGTGYSSLSYLRTFPFDGLKIDKSFLNGLVQREDDGAIIHAIVGLGRALSLTVTAEGIETEEHLKLLKAVACDEGQGYFLSRPLETEALNALIAASQASG